MSTNNLHTESANNSGQRWANNVGIIAVEQYFPNAFVEQTDLEKYSGVSPGKYTIGLGQNRMAFVTDREDIHSICLTVTKALMEKHSISPKDIGFLMVGTESIVDKSKSVKTILMDLFKDNYDIEGLHTFNACYGGTAALFHAINWVESSSWDGRQAIVVAADIAVYDSGPIQATGGCAAVAMLVGPNAGVTLDRKLRSTYMTNAFDFYKPKLESEYAQYDVHFGNKCYIQTLDKVFQTYCKKAAQHKQNFSLDDFDGLIFHAPYCKFVQKSVARLVLLDYLFNKDSQTKQNYKELQKYKNVKLEDTYDNRELEKELMAASKEIFDKKTFPSLMIARDVGNSYTASLYSCLVSYLLSEPVERLANRRLLFFSYGSGVAASMYSASISGDISLLTKLVNGIVDVPQRLTDRKKCSAEQFEDALKLREKAYNRAPYKPVGDLGLLNTKSYYLVEIDDVYRRTYKRQE